MANNESLVRVLLLVPSIQLELQIMLLEKLPEYFDSTNGLGVSSSLSIQSDVARLVLNQFRWLDFLVDSKVLGEKLFEVLSICPFNMKKEMIGSLPEIIGDQNNETVVESLKQMLEEDSSIIVSVLDSFSNLNLDEHLQEQKLCEEILKEIKSLERAQDHKVIDIWLLILIYMNGDSLKRSVEKIFKKKIIEGCIKDIMFDQCIYAKKELVQDYFRSFLSLAEFFFGLQRRKSKGSWHSHSHITLQRVY